jgi:hypothetical protein
LIGCVKGFSRGARCSKKCADILGMINEGETLWLHRIRAE